MRQKKIVISLMVMALLTGCGIFQKPSFYESDLIGRWEAPSESDIEPEGQMQYVVFLNDRDSTGEYRYGYMWDMGDHYDWPEESGTYEDFLLNEEYHGNGWFRWKLTGDNLMEYHFMSEVSAITYVLDTIGDNLMEYHFMSEGWAEIPKSYTITVLSATTLTYQDDFKKSHTFTRVKEK